MDHAKELATHVSLFPNERRGSSRFKLEVPLKIRCQTGEVVQGQSAEMSESGISAIIPLGIIVGQTVELDFELPSGPMSVRAVVRNNSAFRYGFQFIPAPHEQEVIKRACRALAFG
jgi:PilZ domain